MKILFYLSALAVVLAGCGKRDDSKKSTPAATVTVNGSAVRGKVVILNDCGATTAQVQIANSYGTQILYNNTVPQNGVFDFQVQPGNYTLNMVAGSCQATVSPIATTDNSSQRYTICMTRQTTCEGQSTQGTTGGVSGQYTAQDMYLVTGNYGYNSPFGYSGCAWAGFACKGHMYPGDGFGLMGLQNIYVTAKDETELSVSLNFSEGSNSLSTVPTSEGVPWKLKTRSNGQVDVDGVSYDSLSYSALIDERSLQTEEGFCVARDKAVSRMSEYLSLSGFSERAVKGFDEHWGSRLPPNGQFCIYPQSDSEISRMAQMKTTTPARISRLWFFLVPQMDAAFLKIVPIPKRLEALKGKPKNDAFASLKKNASKRQIANDSSVKIEEWGVGFPVEK